MTRPTPALRKARDLSLQLGTELKTATDALAATHRTLTAQHEQTSAIMVERDTTRAELKAERERTSALNDEITRLRTELHDLEIDKARLEGQLARVEKFDPVPPEVAYRDQLPGLRASIDRVETRGPEFRMEHFERRSISPIGPWFLRRP